MSTPTLDDQRLQLPRPVVLVNRILWAAMLLGQIVAAVALAFVAAHQPGPAPVPPSRGPTFLVVSATLLVVAVAVAAVVKWIGYRGATSEAALQARYRVNLIVPMACLEGAAFTSIILAWQLRHPLPLGLFAAGAVGIELLLFPPANVTPPG